MSQGKYAHVLDECYREERPIPGVRGGSVVTWYANGREDVVANGVFTRKSASLYYQGKQLDGVPASLHYRCGRAGDVPGDHALAGGGDLEGPEDPSDGGDPIDGPRGGPPPSGPSGGATAHPPGTTADETARRWTAEERDDPPGAATAPGSAHDSAAAEPDDRFDRQLEQDKDVNEMPRLQPGESSVLERVRAYVRSLPPDTPVEIAEVEKQVGAGPTAVKIALKQLGGEETPAVRSLGPGRKRGWRTVDPSKGPEAARGPEPPGSKQKRVEAAVDEVVRTSPRGTPLNAARLAKDLNVSEETVAVVLRRFEDRGKIDDYGKGKGGGYHTPGGAGRDLAATKDELRRFARERGPGVRLPVDQVAQELGASKELVRKARYELAQDPESPVARRHRGYETVAEGSAREPEVDDPTDTLDPPRLTWQDAVDEVTSRRSEPSQLPEWHDVEPAGGDPAQRTLDRPGDPADLEDVQEVDAPRPPDVDERRAELPTPSDGVDDLDDL